MDNGVQYGDAVISESGCSQYLVAFCYVLGVSLAFVDCIIFSCTEVLLVVRKYFFKNLPIVEWLKNVNLVCELCDLQEVECVIPWWLRSEALAVYKQRNKKQRFDIKQIRQALVITFAVDSFMAFDSFRTQWLIPGETIDVFLAEFQKLTQLVRDTLRKMDGVHLCG